MLLHPVFGFAIFVAVMLVIFQSLFSWSDPLIWWIETAVMALQGLVVAVMPASILRDLFTEGIIGGVGNVVVFLPQILLLFFFIGLLEDSGYMARVAYLMDRIMKSMGLHGRAFVPMLSGMACAVPAIMATRTMERQRDRLAHDDGRAADDLLGAAARLHADHRCAVSPVAGVRHGSRAGPADGGDVRVLRGHRRWWPPCVLGRTVLRRPERCR